MDNIREFLKLFFDAEVEAQYATNFPDLESFNKKLDYMNSFCIDDLNNAFGMIPKMGLREPEYYQKWKDAAKSNPRHLFKLSHYKHEKYGDLYLAYVSKSQPYDIIFDYFECFFITNVDGQLKIVKKAWITESDEDYDIKYWKLLSTGFDDLSFENAGKFISCERYLKPEHCEFSMQDYLKDK